MLDILNLALPFFGLIFIGFACGKLKQIPDAGLAWMNFFILYVALPALFFRILAKTPFEQLAQVDFIKATTAATAGAFVLAFVIGLILRRGNLADATLAGVAGGFGNVGYMGPGLALATLGQDAAVPVALIFSFDALLIFTLVPLLMAFSGASRAGIGRALVDVVRSIAAQPATDRGSARCGGSGRTLRAAGRREQAAGVPVHVRCALRAVRARSDGCAAAGFAHVPGRAAAVRRKACGASRTGAAAVAPIGELQCYMDRHSRADGGATARAHGLRVRAPIRLAGSSMRPASCCSAPCSRS